MLFYVLCLYLFRIFEFIILFVRHVMVDINIQYWLHRTAGLYTYISPINLDIG